MANRRPLPIACFALLCLLGFAAPAQEPTLVETSVLGGRVSLLLPADFKLMSEELINVKYPSANRPSAVYTNDATTINVALSFTTQTLPIAALPEAQKGVGDTFRTAYPSAEWFRDEIREINGWPFILVEVRTPGVDTEVRNLFVATSLDDRLLVLSFNAIRALEAQWMPIGNRIIESVSVKSVTAKE